MQTDQHRLNVESMKYSIMSLKLVPKYFLSTKYSHILRISAYYWILALQNTYVMITVFKI
jgi:hypothetical protein